MVGYGNCVVCGKHCGNWVNYTENEVYFLCRKHWDLWFSFLTDKIYKYPESWKNDKSGGKTVIKNEWFKEFLKRKKMVFIFR
jgi:hypothetical protein